MAVKLERKTQVFERGDSGVGKIRFSKDGKKAQILINIPKGKDEFETKEHILDVSDCPDYIEMARNGKEWMIQMSGDGKKLYSFRPVMGAFVCHTKEFASKENEEPTPKSKEVDFVKDGKHIKYNYEYFTVILELEDEKVKGLTVPLVLHYNFSEFVKDGKSVVGFSMGGKYTNALEEYMSVSGILEEKYQPIEYKDNILPTLQRIVVHEQKKFQITMKDGWIVSGSLIPYDEPEESTPWDEEEVTPKLDPKSPSNPFTSDFDDVEEMEFDPEYIGGNYPFLMG